MLPSVTHDCQVLPVYIAVINLAGRGLHPASRTPRSMMHNFLNDVCLFVLFDYTPPVVRFPPEVEVFYARNAMHGYVP